MYLPNVKLASLNGVFQVAKPYKNAQTNAHVEHFFQNCNNDGQILGEKLFNSLKNDNADKGKSHYIYEFEGFGDYLLKVSKEFKDNPTEALNDEFLIPLAENPDHVVAQIGKISVLKKIPGITRMHSDFLNDLASLPQKSFSDFIDHLEQMKKEGFYHDYIGANTLVDNKTKKINTIDSFEDDSSIMKCLFSSFISIFDETLETKNAVFKKTIKAINSKINLKSPEQYNDQLRLYENLKNFNNKNNSLIASSFWEANSLKEGLQDKSLEEIKNTPQWEPLKLALRKFNRLIDKLNIDA